MLAEGMIALETPYFTIETDLGDNLVRVRRSAEPFPTLLAMERDFEEIAAVLDRMGRDRKRLLIDLRDGPRRNDPEFELAMVRLRPKLLRGFPYLAAIVRTAVGALQVKRHMREDGVGAEVFNDEQDAIDWLRGQSVRNQMPPSTDGRLSRPSPTEGGRGSWVPEPARSSWVPPTIEDRRTSRLPPDPFARGEGEGEPEDD
jgi:hypothetical protein